MLRGRNASARAEGYPAAMPIRVHGDPVIPRGVWSQEGFAQRRARNVKIGADMVTTHGGATPDPADLARFDG